jgi:hypothetical protein
MSLLFVACSKASPPETSPQQELPSPVSEPSHVILKTTGKVRLIGIPAEGMTACEVLIVDTLEPDARERLLRQRELLEEKITGKKTVQSVESSLGISQEEYQGFTFKINQLAKSFPQILSEDVNIGGKSRDTIRVSGDEDVYKEIKALFDAVTIDSLERALPVLGEKLQAQSDRLHRAARGADEESYQRIKLTLDWLASVAEHLNQYINIRNEMIHAERAYAIAHPSELQDWDGYSVYYRDRMLIDISQHVIGATLVGSDGLFEIPGRGEIIVRVEYAPNSAYFIVSDDEKRVRIENLAP